MPEFVDPRDKVFPFFRVEPRSKPADDQPFWLSVTRAEDGLVHQRWDIRFTTRVEAAAAAQALIQLGAVFAAFVNEEVAVMVARRGF